MERNLLTQLEDLQHTIETLDIAMRASTVKEWGGADVIIKSRMDADTEKWLEDQPLVIGFQHIEPKRRAVITKYSKELSWLFTELKNIFSEKLDYVSKYDFYAVLAQSAIDNLANNDEAHDAKGLLFAVLNTCKGYCNDVPSKSSMNLPKNIFLPFFAYGIFKPGQLCHSRIVDLVEHSIECTVPGLLRERDGIPLLELRINHSNIKGYLIYFRAGKEGEAYDRIVGIEPDEVYRWTRVKVSNSDANVLVGKREQRGSSELYHIDEWDGRTDPFFKQGLEEVEKILVENSNFDWDFRALLRLQMAYMLLWSAIERYAGLKYHLGNKATEKVNQIANEKCFADALKKNVKIVANPRHVFSTTDLSKYTLDPSNPKESIKYYYQVRSNTIHRGKAATHDFDTMKSSLEELLAIFKELLNDAFQH